MRATRNDELPGSMGLRGAGAMGAMGVMGDHGSPWRAASERAWGDVGDGGGDVARRNAAAFAAYGPQIMAQYAAYAALARAQTQHAAAFGVPGFGGVGFGGGYPYGVAAYEATSAARGKGARGREGEKLGKVRRAKPMKSKVPKVCVNCKSTETPFWRKDKDGGGSLCNACGLYLAKNDAPRPAQLWRRQETSASEIDTNNDTNDSEKTTEGVPSASVEGGKNSPEKDSESDGAAETTNEKPSEESPRDERFTENALKLDDKAGAAE